jgi:predicted NUDIX family NTP pyrophosphohydrolase
MAQVSAGLLMYRIKEGDVEFFLVHPGGPLWARKDEGVWSIPKGLVEEGEDILEAAKREFEEETGIKVNAGQFIPLSPVRLKSGKKVYAWAFEGDCNPSDIESNTFQMQWPPGSGQMREFPEIDRAGWFGPEEAKQKLNPAQVPFIEELIEKLRQRG